MPDNRVDISIQVKGDAPKQFDSLSGALRRATGESEGTRLSLNALGGQMAQLSQGMVKGEVNFENYKDAVQQLAQGMQQFTRAILGAGEQTRIFPSVMARMAPQIEESSASIASTLDRLHLFAEDIGFSMSRVLEGIDSKFRSIFTDQAKFSLEAGQKAFESLQKSIDDGLSGVFTTAFTKNTEKTLKSWEKFVENLEATFYQSLGRMASALVQENLLAPLFKLGQEAVGGLLSAGKSLFLAEGGLVTKPTLAVLGEAGPEVVLPLEAAGEFVKKTLVGAARSQAFHRQSLPLAA